MLPVCLLGVAPGPAGAEEATEGATEEATWEARIWLDRGVEPVLQHGERVRIYFRSSHDAYAALFHIDTDGRVRLLFPSAPGAPDRVVGGRDYRLVLPASTDWYVTEDPGIGYFFLLTSPRPLDTSRLAWSQYTGQWDLSPISGAVYTDPYVAMDEFVEALLPQWEYTDFALDFTSYHVGQSYSYPRFLCYECHGAVPYRSWNPYRQACASFRVVIYNDPYYYPVTRYRGTQVVYTRPPVSREPQFEFKERAQGEPGTPLVRTREGTPVRGGSQLPAAAVPGGQPAADRLPQVIRGPGGAAGAPPPRSVPTTGGGLPTRTPTSAGGRPVLERRTPPVVNPPAGGGGGAVRPSPAQSPPAGRPGGPPARPPAQTRPTTGPPTQSRPTTQARPTTQSRPTTRSLPPAGPPARANPPARPPPGGGGASPPPTRPPRGGGGG